jgi:hypothetical protein
LPPNADRTVVRTIGQPTYTGLCEQEPHGLDKLILLALVLSCPPQRKNYSVFFVTKMVINFGMVIGGVSVMM